MYELLIIPILILIVLLGKYIKTFIRDYMFWNGGTNPVNSKRWVFMGQDGHKTRFYSDDENNVITITTIADKF